MQHLNFEPLGYLLCTTIHDLRDYTYCFESLQCTKYINSLTLLSLRLENMLLDMHVIHLLKTC